MSEDRYRATIRSPVRALWKGVFTEADFESEMRMAIRVGLTRAFDSAAGEYGLTPDDYNIDEQQFLADAIESEFGYIAGFGADITDNSQQNKGKLTPLFVRAEMWVNRYVDIVSRARVLFGKDEKLQWVYGDTEHCTTCLALNGKVKRASFWAKAGVYPRNPPNPNLECGGYNCQCELVPTDNPVSKGRLPI